MEREIIEKSGNKKSQARERITPANCIWAFASGSDSCSESDTTYAQPQVAGVSSGST